VTEVEIAVDDAWKGAPDTTVKITVPGGRVGRIAQMVDAVPTFQPGEEVVVFLSFHGGRWRLMGYALGTYRVEAGEARSTVEGAHVIPRALAAGERAVGTMSIAELERRVRGAQ
jgi:hypothetical protein